MTSAPYSAEVLLAQCGKATKSNGDEVIVVAGGLYEDINEVVTTTHVYDINLGVWLPGPELPESRAWGRAVQYRDTLVLVGGADSLSTSANFRTQIVQYDPDDEAWVVLTQTLENPDFVTAAMMAPVDFVVDCS